MRGIAAALFVVHHWTPWGQTFGLGNLGVQLFFVLSGFLITGILLDQRRNLELGHAGYRQTLTVFFERRAARI